MITTSSPEECLAVALAAMTSWMREQHPDAKIVLYDDETGAQEGPFNLVQLGESALRIFRETPAHDPVALAATSPKGLKRKLRGMRN